ncbi:hypothetical protein [Vibrio parahaemolyticus]|uniref:hypothetical protein n=1 Tax=Vibrio parahaemolyticus TaxID=670 RepID=UPI0007B54AFD|nr:hypothetical protein [Vibrio parahaemolyticus]EJG1923209.1 hypothetical protein [Vibrio parahaemolyticus]KZW05499.1 hypothetical protein APF57_09410 [Vibrio parahaemolyticus]KZW06420.1 hypothetical protein APF58_10160 [Vibrio parahaemolyticus]KZW14603.1 hypothetical protein APF56_15180 [Vibrio parahaemolyticus]KZW26723.1 hypothetical protein APF59_17515 [Vibrio parahaemolyticus]
MENMLKTLEQMKPLIELSTILTPPLIGLLGLYIAYQQYRTNRMALKKDLFDRRYAVFECVNEFISVVVKWKGTGIEHREHFLAGTKGVEFLFDKKIKEYVDEIWERSLSNCGYIGDWAFPTESSDSSEEYKWFICQKKNINNKFKKYISLKH